MKKIRYTFEAVLLYVLFGLFKVIGLDAASATGGWLGKTIGPRLAASRKAYKNLQRAFPDLSPEEQKRIITGMWENLGRIVSEYPHLKKIMAERIDFKGKEVFQALPENKGAVFFSAHIGNWEINSASALPYHERRLNMTYRAPNNPAVDKLLMRSRLLDPRLRALPKTRSSGKAILNAIKNAQYVGIMIDQKYNEGVAVPFFDVQAMTNPLFAHLTQKYKCPLVPIYNKRLKGAHFEVIVGEPLEFEASASIEEIIAAAHSQLESWITDAPEQWLWLHRRWDSKKLQS